MNFIPRGHDAEVEDEETVERLLDGGELDARDLRVERQLRLGAAVDADAEGLARVFEHGAGEEEVLVAQGTRLAGLDLRYLKSYANAGNPTITLVSTLKNAVQTNVFKG